MDIKRIASVSAWVRAVRQADRAWRAGYRVVHTFFNDSSILLPWAMKRAGLAVIVSRRDEGFWYTRKNLPVLRFNRRYVDLVTANSHAVAAAVGRHEGYKPEKIEVVHNGVLPQRTPADGNSRERLNVELSQDDFVFGIVANLRPLKRIDHAIEAVARLRDKGTAVKLVVVGADRQGETTASHRQELESLVHSRDLAEQVVFLGTRADMGTVYDAIDVGLSCSATEGLSNSIMEMLVAGKPVIATGSGGNPELVEESVDGFLYDFGNVDALTHYMAQLVDDSKLRSTLAENATRKMTDRFSMQGMVDKYGEIYARLATCSG